MKNFVKVLLILLSIQLANAQEEKKEEKKKTSFVIMPIHNSVAGFSNVFLGTHELNEKTNLTFYSIFWSNPSFGNAASGSDLLLETGVGLGFKMLNDKLYVNPTLGLAHGKFLSGGEGTLLAEGVIPSVLTLYNSGRFEFEAYLAYYKAIRKGGPVTKDFILNWVAPGVKVSDKFSVGLFYEQFVLTRTSDDRGEQSIYQWLGGYAKVSFKNGIWLRLAAGPNLHTNAGTSKEFYKIQAFIPL